MRQNFMHALFNCVWHNIYVGVLYSPVLKSHHRCNSKNDCVIIQKKGTWPFTLKSMGAKGYEPLSK